MSAFLPNRSGLKRGVPMFMAIFCVLVWGISYAVTRSAVRQVPPLTLASLRFYLAAGLLWILTRNIQVRLKRSDCKAIFSLTFSGIILYFACENIGLKMTTASHASLIIATIPVGTELIWAWRRGGWPPINVWAGAAAAVSGVFLLVGHESGGASISGDILMFGAVGCWIVYTFQVMKISGRYPPLLVTFYMMLFGAVAFTPGAFLELWIYSLPTPNLVAWGQILFLGVGCSALGYDFWNRAVPALGPTVINTLLYFIPLVGVVGGVIFLDEPVTRTLFWGGGLIFCGVFLARRAK